MRYIDKMLVRQRLASRPAASVPNGILSVYNSELAVYQSSVYQILSKHSFVIHIHLAKPCPERQKRRPAP